MLYDELAPRAMHETGVKKIATAGCSFGGYHAVNFGLKHPDKTAHILSMSGAFDIKQFVDDFYNDDVFYNNPVDFLPASDRWELWQMNIILGTAEHDICLADNRRMSNIMAQKILIIGWIFAPMQAMTGPSGARCFRITCQR